MTIGLPHLSQLEGGFPYQSREASLGKHINENMNLNSQKGSNKLIGHFQIGYDQTFQIQPFQVGQLLKIQWRRARWPWPPKKSETCPPPSNLIFIRVRYKINAMVCLN